MAGAFKGWPAAAIEFYEGLEADNSKAYWYAHKEDYEKLVRAPMEELLAELADEFGEGKIFRPNRDVRFSHDKSPYKTNVAATLSGGGYVSFSADGLGVGAGYYMMATDQLDRYRRAVHDERSGDALVRVVAALTKAGIETGAHDTLKRAPKGYTPDHPRIDLLRRKGLIAWRHWDPAPWLATAGAKKRVVDVLRKSRPLLEWLDREVGPSRIEAG